MRSSVLRRLRRRRPTRRPSIEEAAVLAQLEDEFGPLADWQRDVVERVLRHPGERLVLQMPRMAGRSTVYRILHRLEELR